RPSDYQKLPNYKDYRYADEPMDIPVEVDISAFGDIPAGSNIVVNVYQEMQGKSLLYIRSDVMTTGGAYPIDAAISVPNGFVLVDADPNSPSSLFVKAVNSCKGLKGEDLYPFIIEALKLYDQTDDKIQGVTQAKLDLAKYISEYNAGIVRDNVLMQESIDTMQKSHPNAALHASLLLGLLLCIKRFIHL
ncbi:MAG: hypothetical protein J6R42_00470, partial [Clostridia bacterium]|nr:hypothetical protein [Clostridia bacterium]